MRINLKRGWSGDFCGSKVQKYFADFNCSIGYNSLHLARMLLDFLLLKSEVFYIFEEVIRYITNAPTIIGKNSRW